jgi:FKBP-type peptidyl-prolyl cis-trans isomerase SlpA
MRPETILPGSRVLLHFSLSLDDGSEVVSTFNEEPMALTIGDGAMEPALESKLLGMKSGDEQSLILSGNDVYGAWERDNSAWIDREEFPPSIELAQGQVIAFTTPAGDEVAGTVLTLENSRVQLDFNHPLSGKTIIFRTSILQVEPPE